MKHRVLPIGLLAWLALTACEPASHDAHPPTPQAERAPLPEELVPDEDGRVAITVDGMGYHPSTVHARVGQKLVLVFTRVSEAGCAEELVVPSLGMRRALPIGEPVEIEVTPSEELAFTCGMDMLRGRVVVHGVAAP